MKLSVKLFDENNEEYSTRASFKTKVTPCDDNLFNIKLTDFELKVIDKNGIEVDSYDSDNYKEIKNKYIKYEVTEECQE